MSIKNIILKTIVNHRKLSKKGFTLFVAMIVSSLLLAVGFSIGNIILKQLILSGSGKDSQIAFYAADSGAECAQFWDEKNSEGLPVSGDGPFSTSTDIAAAGIRCGAGDVTPLKVVDSLMATSTLYIEYRGSVKYYPNITEDYRACSKVEIVKGFERIGLEDIPYTKITSRGYNAGRSADGQSCDTTNPRVVERGILVQY